MLNPDGTIFEMEDNVVLPDTCQDDSDEDLINIDNNIEMCAAHLEDDSDQELLDCRVRKLF